jgi:acyl carrier protein
MTDIIECNIEETATRLAEIAQRLKTTLIERLSLQVTPEEIGDDTALFGSGLGLDSVDALEVAVAIEVTFGVAVSDEDVPGFRSIGSIAEFIANKQEELAHANG